MRKLAMVAVLVALCFIVAPTMAYDGDCGGDGTPDHDGDGDQIGNPGNDNPTGNDNAPQDGTGKGSPWVDS